MQTPKKKYSQVSLSMKMHKYCTWKHILKLVTVFKNNGYNYAPDPILWQSHTRVDTIF